MKALRGMNGRLVQDVPETSNWDLPRHSDWDIAKTSDWDVPKDDQILSLGDILERLEEYIFGTSWEPIFSGWVLSIHILYV